MQVLFALGKCLFLMELSNYYPLCIFQKKRYGRNTKIFQRWRNGTIIQFSETGHNYIQTFYKDSCEAEYYVDLLLNINKKNIEANNIKFISLVKQNKKEEADEFLENNEILKNQQNYIELKSLIHPEILAKINEQNNNNEIIELKIIK